MSCPVLSFIIGGAIGLSLGVLLIIFGDWRLLSALLVAIVIGAVLGIGFMMFLCGETSTPAASEAPMPAPETPVPPPPASAPEPAPAPAATTPPAASSAPDPAEAGTRPAGMDTARGGQPDDLKRIKGVGPKLEQQLFSLGFHHFDQIAAWTAAEVAWVDDNLKGFKGRVSRDNWVEQATLLAAGGETEFSKKVDEGDVY
ncbi:NADH:ubiquinone oxidoreductase [Rhodophyticola sp. CCM32]|uniref:DUF2273 domain-containing protein n=1 Tax=Rhodophyticola sp. CCM32 TaxID=2916397 RepID=UPI00107FB730|nr:DUF2273 domain-containing protein [Rhodophyticola sp. CCM32]QBY00150.1 NADH:ubiquinone oxidoreductase [Rhodophyticola sp. CCM32]